MIDTKLPLELADGTPATLDRVTPAGTIYVRLGANSTDVGPRYSKGALASFTAAGRHRDGRLPELRNRTNAVDPYLPMELTDGTPVELISLSPSAGRPSANIRYLAVSSRGDSAHSWHHYLDDGEWSGDPSRPRLRNIAQPAIPALDLTKPLKTADGKPVTYVGTIAATGQIVVKVTYGSGFSKGVQATELRFLDGRVNATKGRTSGDDLVNPVVVATFFQNVYADGTIGETKHTSMTDAGVRSKYGKLRIGILSVTTKNGAAARSSYTALTPAVRSRGASAEAYFRHQPTA